MEVGGAKLSVIGWDGSLCARMGYGRKYAEEVAGPWCGVNVILHHPDGQAEIYGLGAPKRSR